MEGSFVPDCGWIRTMFLAIGLLGMGLAGDFVGEGDGENFGAALDGEPACFLFF